MESAIEHTAETAPEMSGPHPWQIQPWAIAARKLMRYKEYTRWVNEYCTPLTINGADRLNSLHGPAIFVANHQSHMDTPVIVESLPDKVRDNLLFGAAADRWFVKGKKKLILQPWYQSMVMGNFPIVRGGGSKTLQYARWLLDQGSHICIFPEGTRATGSELGEFRHGVTMLAQAARVPVVPIVLKGLREMRPKGSRTITPGPASATILDPIYLTVDMPVADATAVLRNAMNKEFGKTLKFNPPTDKEDSHYVKAKAA